MPDRTGQGAMRDHDGGRRPSGSHLRQCPVHIVCRQLAELLVTDCVQHREQAVPVLSDRLRRRVQALSEPGLGALPDCDLRGRADVRAVVQLGVELLFQFLELVADLGLGPAVDPRPDPPPIRVEAARDLADEALARLPPVDRVLAPATPSHAPMLPLTILNGPHCSHRPSLPGGREGL